MPKGVVYDIIQGVTERPEKWNNSFCSNQYIFIIFIIIIETHLYVKYIDATSTK